jgi:hypothetical protein
MKHKKLKECGKNTAWGKFIPLTYILGKKIAKADKKSISK